jgi:hypothetical protein
LYRDKKLQKATRKRALARIDNTNDCPKGKHHTLHIFKKHAAHLAQKIRLNYRAKTDEGEIRRELFQKRNIDAPAIVKSTMYGKITEEEMRHKLHPPSKLFLKDGFLRKGECHHTLRKESKMNLTDIVHSYKVTK